MREIQEGRPAPGGANCMFRCAEWCAECAERENSTNDPSAEQGPDLDPDASMVCMAMECDWRGTRSQCLTEHHAFQMIPVCPKCGEVCGLWPTRGTAPQGGTGETP